MDSKKLESIYYEVLREVRESDIKNIVNLYKFINNKSISPEESLIPMDKANSYLSPFSIASFGTVRDFIKKFPYYVVDSIKYFIEEGMRNDAISVELSNCMMEVMVEWCERIEFLVKRLLKYLSESDKEIDIVLFSTQVRITDIYQRRDVMTCIYDGGGVEFLRGILSSVEMDLLVLERLLRNNLFEYIEL